MIERTEECFGLKPERLAADTAYGSAANLNWLVNDKKIAPHIPVIDKSKREDGSLSRDDFTFDKERNVYVCPEGKVLTTTGAVGNDHELRNFALKRDCDACPLKPRCCPKTPSRKVTRDVHEDARDVARVLAKTEAFERSCRDRKRVEMLFAHLKRILRLGRLRLRGPRGAQDEFTLAAIARTCAASESLSPDLRRSRPWRALRERRVASVVLRLRARRQFKCQCRRSDQSERRGRAWRDSKKPPPRISPVSSAISATKSAQGRKTLQCNSFGSYPGGHLP